MPGWRFWRRKMLSLAELYERRWREYEQRYPETRTGDPRSQDCRQCGAKRSKHPPLDLEPLPGQDWRVLWCDRCDTA